jgi:thioredoxin-dependent peroxiredoxin
MSRRLLKVGFTYAMSCLVALACLLGLTAPATAAVALGDKAPDFALQADDGTTVHLSDFLNKQRVVVFFFNKDQAATSKSICRALAIRHQDLKNAKHCEILVLRDDPPETHKAFKNTHHLAYLFLSDLGDKVRTAWGVPAMDNGKPALAMYVVNTNGVVKKVFTGVKPDVDKPDSTDYVDNVYEDGMQDLGDMF